MISISNYLFEQMSLAQLQAGRADLLKKKMGIPSVVDGPKPNDVDRGQVGDSSQIINPGRIHSGVSAQDTELKPIGMSAWGKGLKKAADAANER